MRTLIVAFLLVLPVAARAEASSWAPGDRCQASEDVVVMPKGGDKPAKVKKGAAVVVVALEGKKAVVRTDAVEAATALLKDLDKKCAKLAATTTDAAAPVDGSAVEAPAVVASAVDAPAVDAPAVDAPPVEAPAVEPPAAAPPPDAPAPAPAPDGESAFGDSEKIKIAVMDVAGGSGIDKDLVSALSLEITNELEGLGPFRAISAQDIARMLQFEAMKSTLGCDEVSCLAEIGGALGADYVVASSLLFVGGTYLSQMQLLQIEHGRVAARVSREYEGGPRGLIEDVRTATKMLVRDILAQKSGTMRVLVSEEGATIKLDGTIVGISPMPPLSASGGVHNVTVEKEGFVLASRDVDVKEKQEATVELALVPSEEFKREYAARAWTWRIVSFSSLAGGALLAAGSAALVAGAFVVGGELRSAVDAYNAQELRTAQQYDELKQRSRDVGNLELGSVVVGALAMGAVAAGVTLFFVGDDPGKYDDAGAQD